MSSIEYNRVFNANLIDNTQTQYVSIETTAGDIGDVYVIKSISICCETASFGSGSSLYNFEIYTSDNNAGANEKLVYSQPKAITPANAVFNPFDATNGSSFISKQPYLGFNFNLANGNTYYISIVFSKIESDKSLATTFGIQTGTLPYNALSNILTAQTKTIILQSICFTNTDTTQVYGFQTFIGQNNSGTNTKRVRNLTGINLRPSQSVVINGPLYIQGTSTDSTGMPYCAYTSGLVDPSPDQPIYYYASYILAGS